MNDYTRSRIIEEAEALIAEKGVFGMSIGELAERSRTSKGSVQYYFKTKQGIVERNGNTETRHSKNVGSKDERNLI